MCGITVLVQRRGGGMKLSPMVVQSVSRRGTESTHNSVVELEGVSAEVWFHRLAINGLGSVGDQPMSEYDCVLACNGEIQNHRELEIDEGITFEERGGVSEGTRSDERGVSGGTRSDCEVILALHRKYYDPADPAGSVERQLSKLVGVWAMVLVDRKEGVLVVSRDRLGVRPLYEGSVENATCFSSLLKGLPEEMRAGARQFPAGGQRVYDGNAAEPAVVAEGRYWALGRPSEYTGSRAEVREALERSVRRRMMSERPIGCLLSGGLDSSLVTSLVVREWVRGGGRASDIRTFSIAMEGGTDTRQAEIVAAQLGTTHHTQVQSERDFLSAIPEVIRAIESWDTTTVRASVGNWLVARDIRRDTDVRVLFNGDGADEVCGGQMQFWNAPGDREFDEECRRLLREIPQFDVLRSDRSIADNDLEARTPFLDHEFVEAQLTVSPATRRPQERRTKWFLRSCFADAGVLPDEVFWRSKEAFSDGVSAVDRTWGDSCAAYALEMGATSENHYQMTVFLTEFRDGENTIPHYWMPRWCEGITDPSARRLAVYEGGGE